MRIKDIIKSLEFLAPPALQETYDNAGLITGSANWQCTGALVCLDAIPAVIDEAIEKKCNLVVAHHPIVFKGLKKITGKNYVEETIIKAIKNDIAIYAIHTNLDNVMHGVNAKIAALLGLQNTRILAPKPAMLQKLVVFVPAGHKNELLNALFKAGAGEIGNYSECSFVLEGEGSFKPGDGAKPFSGKQGERSVEKESRVEVIFESWKSNEILTAMRAAHPYEEVAYYLS
ncbi:MAG: Nif3-like dinuclear metal center hexameric protein, partial [Chitinophagaceae bacterium]